MSELETARNISGASSIFVGARLLTTANPAPDRDALLLGRLGLEPVEAASAGLKGVQSL